MRTTVFVFFIFLTFNLFSQKNKIKEECSAYVKPNKNNDFFTVVDEMPILKMKCCFQKKKNRNDCTYKELNKFFQEIEYINKDMNGKHFKVYVSFIVEKNKSVSNVEIVRSKNSELNEIVLKFTKKLKKFHKAGKQNGKKVRVKFILPIVFYLTK